MPEVIKYLLGAVGGFGIATAIAIALFLNPEKAQIWAAMILREVARIRTGVGKQQVRLDLQGRINDFGKRVGREAPFLAATRVRVELTTETDREAFLKGDTVVLRLRGIHDSEVNFIHGAYLFIATSLLFKAKRYLSPTQRTALDLFVTGKLLAQERPSALGHFLDEYVHPELARAGAKEGDLFARFETIDSRGHFYSVVLQEFDFLGSKVFGQRKDQRIITEVDAFIRMMEAFSLRKIGEEGDREHIGGFCRMALVIVGKRQKLTSGGDVYVNYIRRELIPKKIETIYLLGLAENEAILKTVAGQVSDSYELYRTRGYRTLLDYGDGRQESRRQYLMVLRLKGLSIFQGSEPLARE